MRMMIRERIDSLLGNFRWYRLLRRGIWKFVPNSRVSDEWRNENERVGINDL